MGGGQPQQQHRHARIALVPGHPDDARQGGGAPHEKARVRQAGDQERGVARHQIRHARHEPKQAQHGQGVAAQRILAGPVGARGQQKAHRDGGHKAPQHFVRMPEHAAQHAGDARGGVHPQPNGRQRPEAARQV
ncbi:hypothetical protein D3C72_1577800 [compost metagenome]